VRKSVWGGLIPVIFTLTPNEVSTLQPPEPYYLMVPRMSFLPIVTDAVKEYFRQSAPSKIDEIWYECNGTILRWQFPIGVLYDLYGGDRFPWPITVHFQNFPSGQILRCPEIDTVQKNFMNMLKEANYLKHGDSSKINLLSINDQSDLWEGVKTNDPVQYWKGNNKLAATTLKNAPIRFCIPGQPPIQEPISPFEESKERTLGSILSQVFPEDFPTGNPSTQLKVIVQGITPPLDTPVIWLTENLSHPDNFVYICLLK